MTTDVEALAERLLNDLDVSYDDAIAAAFLLRERAERIEALESSQAHLGNALRAQSDKIQSMALEAMSDAERIQALEAKCAELEKEARRYRWAIALEDNAEELCAAVMNFGPKDAERIGIEIDARIAAQAGSKEG